MKLIAAGIWFAGSLSLLLTSVFTDAWAAGLLAELYFLAVSVLSPAAFVSFGWDKWKAKRDAPRISEKSLHLLSLFGGWPGAVAGQHLFRHKTVKESFRRILYAITMLHLITALALLVLNFRS